jgi:hypothetical protein
MSKSIKDLEHAKRNAEQCRVAIVTEIAALEKRLADCKQRESDGIAQRQKSEKALSVALAKQQPSEKIRAEYDAAEENVRLARIEARGLEQMIAENREALEQCEDGIRQRAAELARDHFESARVQCNELAAPYAAAMRRLHEAAAEVERVTHRVPYFGSGDGDAFVSEEPGALVCIPCLVASKSEASDRRPLRWYWHREMWRRHGDEVRFAGEQQ